MWQDTLWQSFSKGFSYQRLVSGITGTPRLNQPEWYCRGKNGRITANRLTTFRVAQCSRFQGPVHHRWPSWPCCCVTAWRLCGWHRWGGEHIKGVFFQVRHQWPPRPGSTFPHSGTIFSHTFSNSWFWIISLKAWNSSCSSYCSFSCAVLCLCCSCSSWIVMFLANSSTSFFCKGRERFRPTLHTLEERLPRERDFQNILVC